MASGRAHSRVNAVAPRLVAGRRHDAASVWIASDHEWPGPRIGVIEHFAGGIEGIEIQVGNEHLSPLPIAAIAR